MVRFFFKAALSSNEHCRCMSGEAEEEEEEGRGAGGGGGGGGGEDEDEGEGRKKMNEKMKEGAPASPQQGDLRLSGPPSGQGAGGGAWNCDRRVPADLRADSLATVPPSPRQPVLKDC
ncbi:hypothetical protein PoB_007193600 [Plakobranchus ocellatus]|uniref:Uncharacterized protein n=1 Tax=Plakobranchus ocellatus TaxID=259542 RepID=A0AAV4DNC6_9GAST|nr:hypothetical protein PoB_007193600 [Plakobranchus ocellatus]